MQKNFLMIKVFKLLPFLLLLCFLFQPNLQAQNAAKIVGTSEIDGHKILIFNDYTWKYENHDSVLTVLRKKDSIATYEYIIKEKQLKLDSAIVFSEKWDTVNIFAYGNYDYSKVQDTIVIALITENSGFAMPYKGKLYSNFGWRRGSHHNGIDIDLITGDTVVCAFDGVVRYSGWNRGGYGNLIIIRHFNGLETYYAHLSKRFVGNNQIIKAGEPIGLGGSTGRSYSPHLHFEVRYKDNPFDPLSFINPETFELYSEKLILMPSMFEHVRQLSQAQYHTVSSGDTLWGISRRYGVSVQYLCNINGISENSTLQIGQKLRVK